jgi:hypothetical protein
MLAVSRLSQKYLRRKLIEPRQSDSKDLHLTSRVSHTVEAASLKVPRLLHILGATCVAGAIISSFVLAPFLNDLPTVVALLTIACVSGAGAWLGTCTRCVFATSFRCPREIEIQGDSLVITRGRASRSHRLADCTWYIGDSRQDQLGEFLPRRKSIVIVTADQVSVSWPYDDARAIDVVELLDESGATKILDTNLDDERRYVVSAVVQMLPVSAILGAAVGLGVGLAFQRPLTLTTGMHVLTAILAGSSTTSGIILAVRRRSWGLPETLVQFGLIWWAAGWVASMAVGVRAELAALIGIVSLLEGIGLTYLVRFREFERIYG